MSFARYRRPTPCGYGQQHYFVLNKAGFFGISSLIELTLERYARRFGGVRNEKARALEERLARRECWNPLPTLRALGPDGAFHRYPKELRHLENGWRTPVGPHTPIEKWDETKKEALLQKELRRTKDWMSWRRDEEVLRDCRGLIRQLQKALK